MLLKTKRYILLLLSVSLIVIVAGTSYFNANLGQSKTQSTSKEGLGKAVASPVEETIRQDMSVPSGYNIKTISFNVRRAFVGEMLSEARAQLTPASLSSYPKVKEMMVEYDDQYQKWFDYCMKTFFDLGECEENGHFQPRAISQDIKEGEYKDLKALINPDNPREDIRSHIRNVARTYGSGVLYNGTKYWISFSSEWVPADLFSRPFSNKKVFNFDQDQLGKTPTYLQIGKTGSGTRSEWSIVEDRNPPSPSNVLAQMADEGLDFHFPYALMSEGNYKDLAVSVSFKAVSGKLDRAAGIIFRFVDSNNYYVLRANALENNVILFKYVNGQRIAVATAAEPMSSGLWYNLRVVSIGDSIRGYLDDKPLIDAKDATYAQGLVGLWTKADSVTYFDDLKIEY